MPLVHIIVICVFHSFHLYSRSIHPCYWYSFSLKNFICWKIVAITLLEINRWSHIPTLWEFVSELSMRLKGLANDFFFSFKSFQGTRPRSIGVSKWILAYFVRIYTFPISTFEINASMPWSTIGSWYFFQPRINPLTSHTSRKSKFDSGRW